MSIFKKLAWFFKQEKKMYAKGVFALLVVALVHLIPPYIIGRFIDDLTKNQLSTQRMITYISITFVVAFAEYGFRYVWRTNIFGGAFKLEKIMRSRLFNHFLKMDTTFYQNHRTGDLMAHATNDLQAIQSVAGQGVLTLADSFMTGITTIIAMMILIDWRLTMIAIIPLPFLALVSRGLGTGIHASFKHAQQMFSNLNDKVQESITGMKAIKTFGQEQEDIADLDTKLDDINKAFTKVNFYDALFDPLIILLVGLSYMLTILLGGYYVMNDILSLGQIVAFMTYIGMLVWPMFAVGMLFNVMERGNASLTRVEELLAIETHVIDRQDGKELARGGDFAFDIASFAYPKDEGASLEDIHIELKKGKMLGLVGKTGSGKSTLLRLLMREFDEYQGAITYGGADIKELAMDDYLPLIANVPQDHFLFSMSVADNIRFANVTADMEQVQAAAKIASVHDDILSFKDGYETMVGERGVSLSGGQKQRLSIARALMVNSELLILDDALSAVDAKTEEAILTNLKQDNKQTTIIVAHRLSSVMQADEIIVMDNGRISERGTHEELLASKKWYAQMWHLQQIQGEESDYGRN